MRGNRRNSGFTLAEMLIVMAITVVLLGVSFVGVQSRQYSMTRLEFDAIAKEIYVAAQNHLTEAAGQSYPGVTDYGYVGTVGTDAQDGVYYVLNDGGHDAIRSTLLPDYAIDASILSGRYIIRYQPSTAVVLDVFYSRPGQATFLTRPGMTFTQSDYASLLNPDNYRSGNEQNRENYNGAVIGWYGGGKVGERGGHLSVPDFEIINAERLLVRVTDPNTEADLGATKYAEIKPSLKLIVTGVSSEATKVYTLVKNGERYDGDKDTLNESRVTGSGSVYTIVLDDITGNTGGKDLRFSKIKADTGSFLPGEDLKIEVVAYSSVVLANVAKSDPKSTNSLFADPVSLLTNGSDVKAGNVSVLNVRHLENLSSDISGYTPSTIRSDHNTSSRASQLTDLSWKEFDKKIQTAKGVTSTRILYGAGETKDGCFCPVTPTYPLEYDGKSLKITDVKVDYTGSAGLFGTLYTGSEVHDLALIDFSVTGTTSAGALAGTANTATVTNVLARSSGSATATNISATGSAGGLIGSMTGGSVTNSAAALIVSGNTAGGLIGTASGTVTGCYSGGHTVNGAYDSNHYNVTATGAAGGLIGSFTGTEIENSYSTCSVQATDTASGTAGGLVGTATLPQNGKITNCYCTGLVSGKAEGAFAGSLTGSVQDCQYFSIINERPDAAGSFTYLKACGGADNANVTAFDETALSYNNFVGAPTAWTPAMPYDDTLLLYYGKYNLPSIARLGASLPASAFVATHYGDWPAPEIFTINTINN